MKHLSNDKNIEDPNSLRLSVPSTNWNIADKEVETLIPKQLSFLPFKGLEIFQVFFLRKNEYMSCRLGA
jgi:hypothetical protein